jgi:hypothetical protein
LFLGIVSQSFHVRDDRPGSQALATWTPRKGIGMSDARIDAKIEALQQEVAALACSHRRARRVWLACVSVLVVATASLGTAVAAIPDAGSRVFHGCYANSGGALRVIDPSAGQSCQASESAITWNQRGISWRGSWSSTKAYVVNDAVVYNGSSYIAKVANTNVVPTTAATWAVLAAKGAAGKTDTVSVVSSCTMANPADPCDETKSPGFTWMTGSPVSVTLTANQAVDISGDTSVASTSSSGGPSVIVGICAAPGGVTASNRRLGGGLGASAPHGSVIPVSLERAAMASDLGGAGTYDVGLCLESAANGTVTSTATITTRVFNL